MARLNRYVLKGLVVLLCMSFFSCGHLAPSHDQTADLQRHLEPIRVLNVLVASDDSFEKAEIEHFIAETSEELCDQVGVQLAVSEWVTVDWQHRQRPDVIHELYRKTSEVVQAGQTDLVIGFMAPSAIELCGELVKSFVFLPVWEGLIDDTYRRFIVLKTLNESVLLHEIGHAFIWSHAHSSSGVMMGVAVKLLPFTPSLRSKKFSPGDVDEFLENKWRRFDEKVVLVGQDRPDALDEDARVLTSNR